MDKILALWDYLMTRLQEPSTHSAVAALLALAGLNLDQGTIHDGLVALGIVFGGAGIFVKEAKPLTDVKQPD